MFNTPNIKQAFETFGKEVIQNARANLTRKDRNVSKKLYNGMEYNYEGYKGGFRFTISMPEYGMYQDEGVQGTKSIAKAPKSDFKFGTGLGKSGGLTKGINKWVRRRRFQFRKPNGQFMSYDSTAFLITRSVWRTGIPTTNWFTNAFENKFKRLQPKLEDAFKLDAERFLNFVKKEVFA